MNNFLDDDFLLNNKTAETLYHDYAKGMPIIDYHCHLSSKEIAENRRYKNITELWLGEDHYKWRAMRINGVEERYITGDADDKEKFLKWAETIPACFGNPLYHWTHLELQRFFGIKKQLSPQTADEIWQKCNEMLKQDDFSVRELIKKSNVKVLCTTNDPVDTLEYHKIIADDSSFTVKVLPAFRPDKVLNIDKGDFKDYIATLSRVSGFDIKSLKDLRSALTQRINHFNEMGCRVSDHSLEHISYLECTDMEATSVFDKALKGYGLTENEVIKYKTYMLPLLSREYISRNWVMQLHIGVMKDVNKRMLELIGQDTGFDSIGDHIFAEALANILNAMDKSNILPKTILYCLNPRDNEPIVALTGCFQGGGIPGKMQFGSAWWFNDQKDGMLRQLTALANLGLLSRFIGMTTDSRSFLSYIRHEYFRRLLCNIIGAWIEDGEIPADMKSAGAMVQDICFNNARDYFGIV